MVVGPVHSLSIPTQSPINLSCVAKLSLKFIDSFLLLGWAPNERKEEMNCGLVFSLRSKRQGNQAIQE